MATRDEIIHILFEEAQSWWGENGIGIAADAVMEADENDNIAQMLWSMGMSTEHENCPYADGEGDADYSSNCPTCQAHLDRVAARIQDISKTK